jgi:predicted RNase H-like HicB family nuclease
MKHEFTAVIEEDQDCYVAWCPEISGANGQGATREECKKNLAEAISLILQDRLEDGLRGAPDEAERDVVTIE